MEGTNKFNGGLSNFNQQNFSKFVSIGTVVSVTDDEGFDRIKVSINGPTTKGGDNSIPINELPWCLPMVPKYFISKPKIGEAVYVLFFSEDKKHGDRLYFGPVISQNINLNFDARGTTALSSLQIATIGSSVNTKRIPALKGVFPEDDDIAIQGRKNTDLLFRDDELFLRCGKFIETTPNKNNPYPISFNIKTPAYIHIRNNVNLSENDSEDIGTVTNIVGNKINLLTHKDGSPRFNLSNQDDLISKSEMTRILKEAHPIAFGDIQLKYLKLLKNAFLNRVHNGNGRTATDLTTGNSQPLSQFVKEAEALEQQMLSKNIKIN